MIQIKIKIKIKYQQNYKHFNIYIDNYYFLLNMYNINNRKIICLYTYIYVLLFFTCETATTMRFRSDYTRQRIVG